MIKKLCMILVLSGICSIALAKPELCKNPDFDCYKTKARDTWSNLFEDPTDRGIVMRINNSNQSLYAGKYIAIPRNLHTSELLDFSPLPRTWEGTTEKTILFDPEKHAWGAYDENGQLLRWGPATGGNDWCKDLGESCRTKAGTYRIYSLGNSECVSSKLPIPDGGAPMPYCMFFNGGQAFHGSPGGVIKGNVSHGCVRMFVQDAEWLRYDFVEGPSSINKFRGTKVVVLLYTKNKKHEAQNDVQDDAVNQTFVNEPTSTMPSDRPVDMLTDQPVNLTSENKSDDLNSNYN